jgi:adenylosuccinate synthase
LREGNALREAGYKPELILNSEAMVTTPFDILKNIGIDKQNGHGSVGVGFGQTIQRNDDHYHLYARDLRIPKIRDAKLKLIQKTYYDYVVPENSQTELILKNFIRACDDLIERFEIVDDLNDYQHMDWIFEGSQGIMLDMDYGFFPHVTRSNTTSKNAFEILKKYDVNKYVQTYYVTRAYQTRHGNGPMTNDDIDNSHIINNPDETNQSDGFQGVFRKSVLDLDLLVYAIECDRYNNIPDRVHMVITCLDQVPQDIPVTIDGELKKFKYHEIAKNCGITWVHPSYCNTGILNYTYEQDRI